MTESIRPVVWSDDKLQLLDQRLLPKKELYREIKDVATVAKAIQYMVVRGAPAIGITAAFGVAIAARDRYQSSAASWPNHSAKHSGPY